MTLPSDWRSVTLRASGITVSQFALDVLSAWRKSTPLPDSAYNPLGMPARLAGTPAYPATQYAIFPGITTFAKQFGRVMSTDKGVELRHALDLAESLGVAWRAIHGLNWPGNSTVTDYPAVLLDMVEAKYRSKLRSREVAARKTTGVVNAPDNVHLAVRRQSEALVHAAATLSDAHKAIANIVGRLS